MFFKIMYFLSSEWELVSVCTEDDKKAYLFFMVIGSRCKTFAFTSESSSGACTVVSVVCLKYVGRFLF